MTPKKTDDLVVADLREGPALDQLTALDMRRIQAEQYRRTLKKVKVMQLSRRAVYQTYGHAQKMLDGLWSFRDRARAHKRLDEVEDMTEAIFHIKRALAYLSHFSRREFGRDPEDLKGYK